VEILAGYRCFSTGEAANPANQRAVKNHFNSTGKYCVQSKLSNLQHFLSALNDSEQEKLLLMYANPFKRISDL